MLTSYQSWQHLKDDIFLIPTPSNRGENSLEGHFLSYLYLLIFYANQDFMLQMSFIEQIRVQLILFCGNSFSEIDLGFIVCPQKQTFAHRFNKFIVIIIIFLNFFIVFFLSYRYPGSIYQRRQVTLTRQFSGHLY